MFSLMRPVFLFILFLLLLRATPGLAQEKNPVRLRFPASALFRLTPEGNIEPRAVTKAAYRSENPRLVAIALNITLGMFGMHRLYLGTDVKVPIFYTVTLGGGLVLWVADLVLLVSSKEIEPFMDNPNFFMWNTAHRQQASE